MFCKFKYIINIKNKYPFIFYFFKFFSISYLSNIYIN